jgi:hypothetical protein
MFDENDPELLASFDNSIPDGLIDGSQYAEIVQRLFFELKKLDPDNYLSSITWVMNCVNECYDGDSNQVNTTKAIDVVTALAYYMISMTAAIDVHEWDRFIEHQETVAIPELMEGASAMPFYDIKDDVENIMNVLEQMEQGDFSSVEFIDEDQAREYGIDLNEEN